MVTCVHILIPPFPSCFFYSPNATGSVETLDEQTETESVVSFRRERPRHRESIEQHGEKEQITKKSVLWLLAIKMWPAASTQTTSWTWYKSRNVERGGMFVIYRETKANSNLSKHEKFTVNISPFFPSVVFQGLAWTVRVDWSATWRAMRAPARWWAAS